LASAVRRHRASDARATERTPPTLAQKEIVIC
jgi:hypothetical protein